MFRKKLISSLKRDAGLHKEGSFSKLGVDFDELDADRWTGVDNDLMLAWNFWEGWLDEASHNFAGFYEGINKSEWPRIALTIVASLTSERPIAEPIVKEHFDYRKTKKR